MTDVYAKVNGKKVKVGTASVLENGVRLLKIEEEFVDTELQDITFVEDDPAEIEVKVETTKSAAKK